MNTVGTVQFESWIGAEPRDVYHLLTDPASLLSWLNARREADRVVRVTDRDAVTYRSTLINRRVVVAVSSGALPQSESVLEFSLSPLDGGTLIQLTSSLTFDHRA